MKHLCAECGDLATVRCTSGKELCERCASRLGFTRSACCGTPIRDRPLNEITSYPAALLDVMRQGISAAVTAKGVRGHVSAQELCNGIRQYMLKEYGAETHDTFASWGITSWSDVGKVVFRMINAGIMMETEQDRLNDFDNVEGLNDVFADK